MTNIDVILGTMQCKVHEWSIALLSGKSSVVILNKFLRAVKVKNPVHRHMPLTGFLTNRLMMKDS